MPASKGSPAQGGNTSSDFVRKLYRMLEEPDYSDIVRWGRDGDSFVVLEGEKFSTRVLPKHFKHSNFASFVRQLNKYDFHKVRRPDDGAQDYGPSAWEFKHPDFRVGAGDNLDLIRRKAPSSKKAQQQRHSQQPQPAQQNGNDGSSSQQIQSLTESLCTLQKQLEELSQTNKQLVNEIVGLQKTTGVQRQVHYELLHYLENSSRRTTQGAASSVSSPATTVATRTQNDDLPPALRRARELLASVGPPPPSTTGDGNVDRSQPLYPSPADSSSSSAMFVAPEMNSGMTVMDGTVAMPRMNVYPTAQSTGMETFPPEPMQNVSYSVPPSGSLDDVTPRTGADSTRVTASPPTEKSDEWGPTKPHVFLVEDDGVCAKIGMKFIRSFGCTVELAKDGLEAVKLFDGKPVPHFDLIFMDIIMPRLDGVSATARIREWLPQAPIVAMTSNIRQEDVATYFQYGMTDVLAKPFIREGMQRMLKKHLPHLLAEPSPTAANADGHYGSVQADTALNVDMPSDPSLANAHMAMKFEGTPIQSPSGQTGAWGSPGGMANGGAMANHSPSTGPLGMGGCMPVNGGQLVMGQMGYGGYMVDDRPEKRRRVGQGVMR